MQNFGDEQLDKDYFKKLEADYLDSCFHLPPPNTQIDLFSETIYMFMRIFK